MDGTYIFRSSSVKENCLPRWNVIERLSRAMFVNVLRSTEWGKQGADVVYVSPRPHSSKQANNFQAK